MKIILSGGGTLGPVTPLLAIKEVIEKKYRTAEFIWVGTKQGPEKELVEKNEIPFTTLSSGKFRRYLSFWNITDIFRIAIGFFQSIWIILQEKPDLCISAGGFISVPLHFAAWIFGVPTWIHQQDVQVGLSNKLMAPFAKIVTTSLKGSLIFFSKKKVRWLGNPVRQEILEGSKVEAKKLFKLKSGLPVVLAMGGGTGSLRINQLIVESIPHLKTHCQVIHLSGKERPQELVTRTGELFGDYYQVYQFFTHQMKHAYSVADVVITRGGFGSLTELAALHKPAIVIPKPGHQEENVGFLEKAGGAIFVNEETSDGNHLAKVIKELLQDDIKTKQLGNALSKLMPVAKDKDIIDIFEGLTK